MMTCSECKKDLTEEDPSTVWIWCNQCFRIRCLREAEHWAAIIALVRGGTYGRREGSEPMHK